MPSIGSSVNRGIMTREEELRAIDDWLRRKTAGEIPPIIKKIDESENFATYVVDGVLTTIGRHYDAAKSVT